MDIVLVVALIAVIISIYILLRNNRVYVFRLTLNDMGYNIVQEYLFNIPVDSTEEDYNSYMAEHKKLRSIWHSINDISYNKMMFSIKPLKPEYWLTKEQLDFLKKDYEELYRFRAVQKVGRNTTT